MRDGLLPTTLISPFGVLTNKSLSTSQSEMSQLPLLNHYRPFQPPSTHHHSESKRTTKLTRPLPPPTPLSPAATSTHVGASQGTSRARAMPSSASARTTSPQRKPQARASRTSSASSRARPGPRCPRRKSALSSRWRPPRRRNMRSSIRTMFMPLDAAQPERPAKPRPLRVGAARLPLPPLHRCPRTSERGPSRGRARRSGTRTSRLRLL